MTDHMVKTAIVTGGVSGIGYGLVTHLLSKTNPQWRVIIADIRSEAYDAVSTNLDPDRHIFVQTDVASWDEQATLFKKAYAWSEGRVDFFAANAGISEVDHVSMGIFGGGWDIEAEPQKPDVKSLDVNLNAVFYGLRLFVHYSRKTNAALKAASGTANGTSSNKSAPFHPKMVITASCVALYPFPLAPAYNASKHGVLALTRAVGRPLLATDNIAVNCIMPAFVDTGIMPKEVTNLWPPHWVTPISTMVRAYDELTSEDGSIVQDGNSNGSDGAVKSGESVECVVDKLFYRKPVDYADESQQFLIEQSFLPDGVWAKGIQDALKNAGAP